MGAASSTYVRLLVVGCAADRSLSWSAMQRHLSLPADSRHFDRWLALFEHTAWELCPPKAAEHFIERARRIGESLELGIAGAHGVLLAKHERFRRAELEQTANI